MNKRYNYHLWLLYWLEVYKKPYNKSTVNIEIIIRKHIPDKIKNKDIADITFTDIQITLNAIPMTRTRLETYNVYNGSLEKATRLGLINSNPCNLVVRPYHKRKSGEALTFAEIKDFIKLCPETMCGDYFQFLLFTGCRRSEGLQVRCRDIDLEKRVVHIRGTKTELSDRYVPINKNLYNLLYPYTLYCEDNEYLFKFCRCYVTKQFKKICPNHHLHDLRHTFATLCLESGIPIKVVQRWLGHSSIKVTADIYSKVRTPFEVAEMEKFPTL